MLAWQSPSYSNTEWTIITDLTTLYDSSSYYYLDFGLGMQGTVNSIYMTFQYLKFPSVIFQNGDSRNVTRNTCFNSMYEYEPYCIDLSGWGNGVLKSSLDSTAGEVCDDGNNNNGDGWDSTCQIEYKWEWSEISNGWVSKWNPKWGNSKLESSIGEQCDDGNTSNNDGWSSTCLKEVGYTFAGAENAKTVATPICGDQIRVPSEKWDDNDINDGNYLNLKFIGKGCKSDWTGTLRGWYWSSTSPNPSVCNFVLMDGVRAINGEECDDGNSNNNDGWTNTGTISPDYRYTIFSINKMQNFTLHKIEFTYFF